MAENNMLRPSLSQLTTRNESYYSLVIGVAKRAREISDELYSQGQILEEKPVKTSIEEFASGKYIITEGAAKRSEPESEPENFDESNISN